MPKFKVTTRAIVTTEYEVEAEDEQEAAELNDHISFKDIDIVDEEVITVETWKEHNNAT
tara:strand:+ start:59 stop:235 length:177 start_codon:yes stop_codon:yes gene_type:complete